MRKNFFAILSTVKSNQIASRELESLPPRVGEWYRANNGAPHPDFVYNLLVSKLIHLINTRPNYQNRGRLDLNPGRELQYSEPTIRALLQLYFNRDDADCSVLFLTGHGTPGGELMLWTKCGEAPLAFQTVADLWNNRTSKGRNRELLIVADFCFSGQWVSANQQPDILIQSSCANKEKARDIKTGDQVWGSVFLHNLLMLNGVADCFFEASNQNPTCSFLKGTEVNRVRNVFELNIMRRNWDDFKGDFRDKVRAFTRDSILWEGPPPIIRGGPGPLPREFDLIGGPIKKAVEIVGGDFRTLSDSRGPMDKSVGLVTTTIIREGERLDRSGPLNGEVIRTTVVEDRGEAAKRSFHPQASLTGSSISGSSSSYNFRFGNR